jgi:hypothetical protein
MGIKETLAINEIKLSGQMKACFTENSRGDDNKGKLSLNN